MKLSKEEWKKVCDRVILDCRPTQNPIAMKFIRTQEEFDSFADIQYCKGTASVCKLMGMASHFPGTFGLTRDHFSGTYCATNNGCYPVTEEWLTGEHIAKYPLCWHHNVADSKKHTDENLKVLPKEPYIGVVCSNLANCGIDEPDVIALRLPTQAAYHLLAGYVESDYEKLYFSFSGESNCIDAWMETLMNKKVGLSLGCRGDRGTGAMGYGDVQITMTGEQLIKALDGFETIVENGIPYPYNPTCMYAKDF